MFEYLIRSLAFFRVIFSRESTWMVFMMIVLGFLGTDEMVGITSFCRFWVTGEDGYHMFLHFFRSSAWSMDALVIQWTSFVLSQDVTVKVSGRAVLLGDHTSVAKDGRKIPGVVSLHQDSETQSKPSYFRGHYWGAVGLLVGKLSTAFCLPVDMRIHSGMVHIGHEKEDKKDAEKLGGRIVQMALNFTIKHNLPAILVLDAFFPTASVFALAGSVWSIELKQPLIHLIVRAKKNYVAYFKAEQPSKRKRGKPKKYGEKVKIYDLFKDVGNFPREICQVYGRLEEVPIMAINLLWKPTGELVRFILAVTSRGPIALMCSYLEQNPVEAIELYCARTRIEIMFDMLKNLINAFEYHFWSKLMPRHSRKPKKNKDLKKPSVEGLPHAIKCWEACERFVMLASISLGLLQLIALRYTDSIWDHFDTFLRTRSRALPSERTVKWVIAKLCAQNILNVAPDARVVKNKNNFQRKILELGRKLAA